MVREEKQNILKLNNPTFYLKCFTCYQIIWFIMCYSYEYCFIINLNLTAFVNDDDEIVQNKQCTHSHVLQQLRMWFL